MSWENNVKKVVPYVPGEQPQGKDIIKLNTNENPYPPSRKVKEALENIDINSLGRYPDPQCTSLREAIASLHGVSKENVFTGVGSDDVLGTAFQTFFNSDKEVLFPDITYSFYTVWCGLFNIAYREVPLMEDFSININDYKVENGGIVIANPNAPTGIFMDISKIEELVRANSESLVIIDEAYADFAPDNAVRLSEKYDNLLIIRTFSKSAGLAGMRIGYAIGNSRLIKYMNDVKFSYNSYTVNLPSLLAGEAALKDRIYFNSCVNKIIKTREELVKKLEAMGFSGPKSHTNFLFLEHENIKGEYIYNELKKRNIYVRYFPQERISNFIRISIGRDSEMEILVKALRDIVLR